MAHAFSFNGVDLGSSTYGLTLLRLPRPLAPVSKLPTLDVPYRSGVLSHERWPGPRTLSLNCRVVGTSASNLFTKLDSIAAVLNEPRPKQLIFDFQTTRYYMAQLDGEIGMETIGNLAAAVTINFLCADPHAYSTSLTTQTEVPFTSGSAFDVPDSAAALGGTAFVDPIINVKPADAGGTITASITVACSPYGKTTTQTADFTCGSDKWFRLHCGLRRWQIATGGSGATPPTSGWTDAMTGVTGEFPKFQAGVSNTLTITTGTSGGAGNARNVCVVQYRARYL